MNSDSNLEALVAELKADLPSERDSSRLRARLCGLGIAAVHGVAGSAAAATATTTAAAVTSTATTGAAAASATAAADAAGIAGAAQASISVMALKTFAVALVAGAGVTSSAWYLRDGQASAASTANTGAAASLATGYAPSSATPPARAGLGLSRVEREASTTQEANAAREVTSGAAKPAQSLGLAEPRDRAEKFSASAVSVEARLATPRGREVSALGNASPPTAAAAPLVADGATSTAAFAAPASAPVAAASAAPAPSTPSERAVEATTLRAETLLLDRALSALRASDTALAARLLAQHRARFPDGLLKRERERAERKLADIEAGRGAP